MCNRGSIAVTAAIECARPLFFANEDAEFPISISATCFLISFKGHIFAITAEHALTSQQSRALDEARVGVAPNSLDWLPFRNVYGFPRGNELKQALDFLIDSVDEDLISADKRELLTLVEPTFAEVGEVPASSGQYMVVGFPSSGTGIDYDEKRVRARRELLKGRYDRWDEKSGCHRLNVDALPLAVTTLKGMSGSPVFLLDGEDSRKQGCRLVGVLVTGSVESMKLSFIDMNRVLEFLDCLV